MARRQRYHRLFASDVVDAAGWYNDRSPGRGDLFIDAIEQCTLTIAADPERFGVLPVGLRYVKIMKYPYVILFEIDHNSVFIWGVMHTARSLESWSEQRRGYNE